MSSNKPLLLATNDDGIQSGFLLTLVEELVKFFDVITCAPDGERSWIGHAISRNAKLITEEVLGYPSLAYSLNGTPADCVNLACGNLMKRSPDIVVSGINLGYNITMPMILSSGTVGAAMEASLLGHRAMACSMCLPNEEFEKVRKSGGKNLSKEVEKSLRNTAKACARYAKNMASLPKPNGLSVHNLNFPSDYSGKKEPILTFADNLMLGNLFEPVPSKKYHQLVYRPEWLDESEAEIGSDLWALKEGIASVSRLDFKEASGKSYFET